jgi:hypothetical protein
MVGRRNLHFTTGAGYLRRHLLFNGTDHYGSGRKALRFDAKDSF